MMIRSLLNKKGVTLIELLVVLVITAITMAGIYKVFVSQTTTYSRMDQVMEIQQSVRGAMEIMLRDLRMTGFDDDNGNSDVTIPTSLVTPVQTSDITINYEYYRRNDSSSDEKPKYESHQVRYWRDTTDANNPKLRRTITIASGVANGATTETVLENVDALTFTYGIDRDDDGIMDDQNNNNQIDINDWLTAAQVVALGNPKVVAIRVSLTGRADQIKTDVSKVVSISPRTLISAVTLRNISKK